MSSIIVAHPQTEANDDDTEPRGLWMKREMMMMSRMRSMRVDGDSKLELRDWKVVNL